MPFPLSILLTLVAISYWLLQASALELASTPSGGAGGPICRDAALTRAMAVGGAAGSGALDYFVTTSGSDATGDGSVGNPWATIAFAATRVSPGATVHVAPGTYVGSFHTYASGTPDAPINYVSETKWGARLIGTKGSTWGNYGAYVSIVNFDITGPGLNGIYTEGDHTRIVGNNVHNVLTNRCDSMGGSGINLNGPNAEVIGNTVHDNGPYPMPCGYVHGIYFLARGGLAADNIIFRNAGWGIQLWHNPSHITIMNNTIFRNLTGGIVIGNDVTIADYCVVNNNIVYDNARGISEQGNTGIHNVYENNLVYRNPNYDIRLQNGNEAMKTVRADPRFVDYTGDGHGDYHLQATSPAIGRGTARDAPRTDYDGRARPAGRAPDIGALEYIPSLETPAGHGR